MIVIEIAEAEQKIDELLESVISGQDEVVFTKNGQALAKLIPCADVPDGE